MTNDDRDHAEEAANQQVLDEAKAEAEPNPRLGPLSWYGEAPADFPRHIPANDPAHRSESELDLTDPALHRTPTGYETYIGWSIEEIRLQADSWNRDKRVRKLAQVDGLGLSEPLLIEQIACMGEETGYAVDFTVWSPKGWMFGISVPQTGYGWRPLTVVIYTEFPR